MVNRFLIILTLLICKCIILVSSAPRDPVKKIRHMVNDDGYPFEEYVLKTQDGYFLKIHRIPGGQGEKNNQTPKDKPIAFLVHALSESSIDWVSVGPTESLAYLLADKGFDVWLGNNRGTIFAQEHATYLSTSFGFWNFSWHESGIYDLPETIDFILNHTGKSQLFFVCFSQSCTELLVMGSLKTEYNKKISLAVNLAPIVFTGNVKGTLWPIGIIAGHFLSAILESVGHFDFTVSPLLVIISTFIFNNKIATFLSFIIIYSLVGIDFNGTNMETVRKQILYIPGGVSTKQWIHYSFGVINPGTFRQYDYGKDENIRKYNSTIPPDYPLEKVTIPMAIFHGLSDFLANPKDIELLIKKLPNVVSRHVEPNFNHVDFSWAQNLKKLVYAKIVDLFIDYGKNKTCNK